jgi:radical SAM protein with 4Fe4S-binding SPASM domain
VTDLPPTICALPWLNLSLDVDGSSRPCCKFSHLDAASPYQLANLRDSSLDEVWNSAPMQRLRSDFRAGVQPAECSSCWDEEAVGIRSFRESYLSDRAIHAEPDYDTLTPEQPAALDLKLSNACNLKCRICGPVASSSWLAEEISNLPADSATASFLRDNKSYFQSNKITGDAANAETLRRWAPHIDHVEMTGGEPMMSRENRDIIDLIVEHGRPERTMLLITTNATMIDDRILRQIPHFGSTTITLSIDDIGRRLEYERSPSDATEVMANIARYASLSSSTCRILINCSVSTLNVWYLPEFLDWVTGTYPDGKVMAYFNMVHNPRHACLQVIPSALKAVITKRLDAAAAGSRWPEQITNEQTSAAMRPADQLAEVVSFMNGTDEPDAAEWSAGLRTIAYRDTVRAESFAETFPEYTEEIVRLGLWAAAPSPVPRTRRLIARLRG